MEYIFELPVYIISPRKTKKDKKLALNMNTYRNLQHFDNNYMKQNFKPDVLPEQFAATKIQVSYHIEMPTKRRFDTMNIVSVVDKFFLDWLQKNEYIPDDTCDHVSYGKITGVKGTGNARAIASEFEGVASKDVLAAQSSLNEYFGTSAEFSKDIAGQFAQIQKRTGLSNKALGMYSKLAIKSGKSIK